MKKLGYLCVFMFILVAQSAMADLMGLANGRSANLDNMADMSVEGGVHLGGDGKLFGARVNFKASPDLMVFGDIGMYSDDSLGTDVDGLVYGFGAFYQLRNTTLLENTDIAVKAAYHLGTLDVDGVSGLDLDFSEVTIEGLISGDQLSDTDFGWYANAGLHIIDKDIDDKNRISFGVGITKPLSFGEFFAGIDAIDGAVFVAGVRYNL